MVPGRRPTGRIHDPRSSFWVPPAPDGLWTTCGQVQVRCLVGERSSYHFEPLDPVRGTGDRSSLGAGSDTPLTGGVRPAGAAAAQRSGGRTRACTESITSPPHMALAAATRSADCQRSASATAGSSTATVSRPSWIDSRRQTPASRGPEKRPPAVLQHLHGVGSGQAHDPMQPLQRRGQRMRRVPFTAAAAPRPCRRDPQTPTETSAVTDVERLVGAGPTRRQARGRRQQRLARRQRTQQGAGPVAIELREHVVEQQDRRVADRLAGEPVPGQPQSQGERTLFALRGVGTGGQAGSMTTSSSRCGPTSVTPRRSSSARDRPAARPAARCHATATRSATPRRRRSRPHRGRPPTRRATSPR